MVQKRQEQISQRHIFWQTHVNQWANSGLSQAEYCRKNNLKLKSFTYFKSKFKKKNLSVQLVQIPEEQFKIPSYLKLNIASGLQIEIPDGFSRSTLEQVLMTLRVL
jgi:hypothetical protein